MAMKVFFFGNDASPDADFSRELKQIEKQHQGLATKAYLASAATLAGSFAVTTKGLIDSTAEMAVADVYGVSTALIAGMAGGGALAVGTIGTMAIAMNAAKKQWFSVSALAGTLCLFTVCISTNFSAIGLVGSSSLVRDMGAKADQYSIYREVKLNDAAKAKSIAKMLEPTRDSYCDMAHNELTRGGLSSSAGKGGVYAVLSSTCAGLSTIVTTLENTASETEDSSDLTGRSVRALVDIPKDASLGDVFARQKAFRNQAQLLLEQLGKADDENVRERVRIQLRLMNATVNAVNVQDGSFGQKQANIIEGVRSSLQEVSDIAAEFLDASENQEAQKPKPLLDMGKAIRVFWRDNIAQWMLALMLDLMAPFYCAMLMVSHRVPHARTQEYQAQQADFVQSTDTTSNK
ncbi:MAG: hypothetical protein AAF569_00495 [Pseudomonadota bacterium]